MLSVMIKTPSFLASCCFFFETLILKPMISDLDEAARRMSDSMISPMPEATTKNLDFGREIMESSRVSKVATESDLRITGLESGVGSKERVVTLFFVCCPLLVVLGRCVMMEPMGGTDLRPRTWIGSPGKDSFICWPWSPVKDLTLPTDSPVVILSPRRRIPRRTITLAMGPEWGSRRESMTGASRDIWGSKEFWEFG